MTTTTNPHPDVPVPTGADDDVHKWLRGRVGTVHRLPRARVMRERMSAILEGQEGHRS
jgi:hypothetical protein